MNSPNFQVTMATPKRARVEIYDLLGPSQLGMIDARSVSQALKLAGEVDVIELHVNSRGGSAFEGMAIANILAAHPARKEAIIDGVAASAATLPLMVCESVQMPANAMLMIHNPVASVSGNEADLKSGIEMLQKVKRASVAMYAAKTGKTPTEIEALMSAQTWFTGKEAIAAGFATAIASELPPEKAPTKEQMQLTEFSFSDSLAGLMASSLPVPVSKANEVGSMPDSKTPETPAGGQVPAAPATAVATLVLPPQITPADVTKHAGEAAMVAVANERKRVADVLSLCTQAKKPDLARKHIDEGTPVVELQAALFKLLCEERKPQDDGGTGLPTMAAAADPNKAYEAEFKSNPHYAKMGMKIEDYVAVRRVDDGLDVLQAK